MAHTFAFQHTYSRTTLISLLAPACALPHTAQQRTLTLLSPPQHQGRPPRSPRRGHNNNPSLTERGLEEIGEHLSTTGRLEETTGNLGLNAAALAGLEGEVSADAGRMDLVDLTVDVPTFERHTFADAKGKKYVAFQVQWRTSQAEGAGGGNQMGGAWHRYR